MKELLNDDLWYLQVVRLLYHLVKFGYYLDSEDVENLLPPLLQLLDGRKDYPYPKDKDKGISQITQEVLSSYASQENKTFSG